MLIDLFTYRKEIMKSILTSNNKTLIYFYFNKFLFLY